MGLKITPEKQLLEIDYLYETLQIYRSKQLNTSHEKLNSFSPITEPGGVNRWSLQQQPYKNPNIAISGGKSSSKTWKAFIRDLYKDNGDKKQKNRYLVQ